MKVTSISHKKFRELEHLELDKNILNTEGKIYIIADKNGWLTSRKAVKRFYNDGGDFFSNKLLTINSLVEHSSEIAIEELVMPEKLVVTGSKIVGYTMNYIENINFKTLCDNIKIDFKQIIEYFKQIGTILEKIEKINKYSAIGGGFYLNDIHESNFIINKETNKINIVDIDSCKIGYNRPFPSKYLTQYSQVVLFPNKYHVDNSSISLGYIDPDMNSDLYCYTVMIINYLYKGDITKLNVREFYCYLDYLNSIGFSYNVTDCFSKLYTYVDNMNPKDILDEIPENCGRASSKVYNYVKCGVRM